MVGSMRGVLVTLGLLGLGCGAHPGGERMTAAKRADSCTPELYGAGLFTTGAWDFFMAFSPDQRRVIFGRADDAFERFTMYETRLDAKGRWSRPELPRFAREWSNADPHLSPDGRTVFFISDRPEPGEPGPRASYDIWSASLGADGEWEDARRLPAPVNDKSRDEWSPAVAANGNLYFGGDLPGTHGGSDLWVSRWVDGAYQPPENLGAAINSSMHELEPWIAPDESYLIFSALRRPDGLGRYDLFLSRKVDGKWEPARRLCAGINTRDSEYNHSVSPDGKWLYFSSTRPFSGDVGERFDTPRDDASLQGIGNGTGDMYRIPMSAIGL
ncbi:Xaa-Pro aminopeptidase [Myxococcus sp. XM-1-1-1]|uniref:Xaa-Pro aminopeptidase n=1 Tax=Myxococcus sp. XM-1-1-1 TaxID=2874602 RepID=UPI001CBCF0C5|nr:Xaa-Pro aminopeptidase [Myxococcus sp. XM-1-1-1]MBZ4410700.1 Xaa-Pro aminopeptidase [Myxococcus sp. XM-1-1-1]